MNKISSDRRTTTRHQVCGNSRLSIASGEIVSHSLIDISEGGLAFIYNGSKSRRYTGKTNMDYFDEVSSISNIRIQIVSDSLMPSPKDTNKTKEDTRVLRRCGVKFINPNSGKVLTKILSGNRNNFLSPLS